MKLGRFHAQGHYIMESDQPGAVPHYAAKVFCQGDGNERRTPDEAAQLADEIARLLNAYASTEGE